MKICVIGGGSIGKRHLKNIKQNYNEVELFCFKRSIDQDFSEKFSCTILTQKSEILLLGIETIIICTPTSMHLEWIEFACEEKLNVFVEKPLVSDIYQ